MTTIIERFNGGPVGIDTIAASIGEERVTIEDAYEPYLIQSGLLYRTHRRAGWYPSWATGIWDLTSLGQKTKLSQRKDAVQGKLF